MNNRILIIVLLSLFFLMEINCNAQVDPPPEIEKSVDVMGQDDKSIQEEQIFDFVEIMPEFPGGYKAFFKFLADNIVYPVAAKEEGIQGKTYIQFVIWKDGSVRDIKVLKGIDSALDKEALRVIKMMPKWKHGIQGGKPANTRFTLPIFFKLDASNSINNEDKITKAKEMIKEGYRIKKISKETGLSKLEIKDLEEQMN